MAKASSSSSLKLVELQGSAAYWAEKTLDGTCSGVVIVGPGGLGKTYSIEQLLRRRKIQVDEVGRNSHVTPLALYQTLFEHRDDKVLLIDDCEHIYKNEVAVGILRSALWGSRPASGGARKRVVTYSTSKSIGDGIPNRFTYRGGIIVIGNKIPREDDPIVEALLTRVPTVEYKIEPTDVYAFMRQVMCKKGYVLFDGKKQKDVRVTRANCEAVIEQLEKRQVTDLRKLELALILWQDFKKQPSRLARELDHLARRAPVSKTLTGQPPKERAKEVFKSLVSDNSLSTEEQVETFSERTAGLRPGRAAGYDRSTFFRWKKAWREGRL